MAARTKPRFGPADHGRSVSDEVAESAEYVGGFKYEVIDGKLYVTPRQNLPENLLESWLYHLLDRYSEQHPEIVNFVATKSRIYVPGQARSTIPEPDLAVYSDVLLGKPLNQTHWRDISPFLVVEVMVEGEFEKDLSRNPILFHRVPSVSQYWVVNGTESVEKPSLIQYSRTKEFWDITTHRFGSKFRTNLLPDFELEIKPRWRFRK